MKTRMKRQTEIEETISIQCDICKKEYLIVEDWAEVGEFFCIEHFCGYNSVFGDMNNLELDVCDKCFNEKLGKFVRLTPM